MYAFIIVLSAIISKFGRESQQQRVGTPFGLEISHTVEKTVEATNTHLNFISQSASYRWHMKWAPTYSALMLTFTGACNTTLLSFRPWKLKDAPGAFDARELTFCTFQLLSLFVLRSFGPTLAPGHQVSPPAPPWQSFWKTIPIKNSPWFFRIF